MAGALYEGKYPLATALGRPLIAQRMVLLAQEKGASAVAHGCTGKGNDQVRFDVTFQTLDPSLQIIAPVREWKWTRTQELEYAAKHGIEVEATKKSIYSTDQNLWGRSIEAGILEDPWVEPPADAFQWTTDPQKAPDKPEEVEIGFEKGKPVSLNGVEKDAVYNNILANHRLDKFQGESVWAYNGQVWDGVLMNVRGNSSRTDAKVNWNVEFPKGYETDFGGILPYPLDEFALQNYKDNFADVGWATVAAAGAKDLAIVPVRTERNAAFWSLGRIMEKEDGAWRDARGVDDWAIYKGDGGSVGRSSSPATLAASGWLDKKTREDEDFTDVWTLSNTVDASASSSQQAWIYKNVNIPALINYMAINSIIRHHDSGWYNWWLARDTEGTGRWEMWHWDLNWIFTTPSQDGNGTFLTPDTSNRFTRAMLAYPEFRQMFYRRLRTLTDQFLAPGRFEAQWDAITARTQADWNLDRAKWGGYSPSSARTQLVNGLADRRNTISRNTPALVPTSQAAAPNVVISELHYKPAGTGGEFIELTNPNSTAVDISGWTIPAVDLTIQAGTVIPANGRVVFVENDAAFRAAYPSSNRFVGGQFGGGLKNTSETVELLQGSRVVDTVTYSNVAPGPTAADGTGPSLELTSISADNSLPSNWSATSPATCPGCWRRRRSPMPCSSPARCSRARSAAARYWSRSRC